MTNSAHQESLADLLICACSRVWAGDGEVLASGIGLIPRLAASLAMLRNPELMMTDSEAYMVSEPVPVGPDRKSTRLNSSHSQQSRMPSSA